jgi:endonuclease YncB( thermonuclease family)
MSRLRQAVPVDILRVIDGDTVEVRAHIWLDQTIVTRVRLKSIDAPELRAGCPLELAKAEAARAKLAALLGEGPAFLTGLARDKYGGRVLGQLVTATGEDAGAHMLGSGHARAYGGGKRTGRC